MAITLRSSAVLVAALLAGFASAARAQGVVAIDGERIFPESLDSGPDGTLYIGSIGKGAVFRAAPGAAKATIWLEKAPNKISAALGVVADAAHGALWVCSSDINRLGEPVSLKMFDIKSGALKADYPFPESKGLCNDIVIAGDGTAYATDTPGARVFRVKPGAVALELWAADPRFDGADGIAFGPKGEIIVNNVRSGALYSVEVKADGGAGAISEIKTSRPLEGPDGMRPTGDGRLVFAENRGGKISIGTFEGDTLKIETLKEGLENPPGVTVSGGNIWYIESKSKYRNDPAFKDKDAGPFVATAIPLPPKK